MTKTESVAEIADKANDLLDYNERVRSVTVFSLEILLSLQKHMEIFNKNKIPFMFIIWQSDCYKSIIVGLRKILEPKDKKRKCLAVLVDLIKDKEEALCENHINFLLEKYRHAEVRIIKSYYSPGEMWETKEEDIFEKMLRRFLSYHKKIENINSLSDEILIDEHKSMLKEKIEKLLKKYKDYKDYNEQTNE